MRYPTRLLISSRNNEIAFGKEPALERRRGWGEGYKF
jgi:hypothetical protein